MATEQLSGMGQEEVDTVVGRRAFRGCIFPEILGGQPGGALPTPANSRRKSEPAFVEAEMGYALRLAGRRWEVSRS